MLDIRNESGTLEIMAYGPVGGGFFGEGGITSDGVQESLERAGDVKTIRVRLNSTGGSAFDGFGIYQLLINHPARVEVEIEGLALSAASVIAMAGDQIRIAEHGLVMVHEPFGFTQGTADDHRTTGELLDKVRDSIVTVYARRTEQDTKWLGTAMAAETWMDAIEAVENGFADSVVEGKGKPAAPEADAPKPPTNTAVPWIRNQARLVQVPVLVESTRLVTPTPFTDLLRSQVRSNIT